jgi:hypothetical protein
MWQSVALASVSGVRCLCDTKSTTLLGSTMVTYSSEIYGLQVTCLGGPHILNLMNLRLEVLFWETFEVLFGND